MRCLRENKNTEYTHSSILETECMSCRENSRLGKLGLVYALDHITPVRFSVGVQIEEYRSVVVSMSWLINYLF